MILHSVSALYELGNHQTARAWASEVAAYVNAQWPAVMPMQVFQEVIGEHTRLHLLVGRESLANLERVQALQREDAGYQALLQRAYDARLFVASSLRSSVLRAV